MIIITFGGLLTVAFVIAIIFFLFSYFFGLLSLLICGTSKVGGGLLGIIRAKRFYKDCKERGLEEPGKVSYEKLKLIAQLHKVDPKESYNIYSALYKADHPHEYPEVVAEKKKRRKTFLLYALFTVLAIALAYLTVVITNAIIDKKYSGYNLIRNDSSGAFIILWIIFAICYVIFVFTIPKAIKEVKDKKASKARARQEMEDRINRTR